MIIAKIKVDGVTAVVTELSKIPKGIQGATIEVTYGDAWNSLKKTAVFSGCVVKDVVNPGTQISIPPEVVSESGYGLRIGFYGVDDESKLIIPTLWAELGTIQSATDPSGDSSTNPSLPVWAQIQAEVEELKAEGGGGVPGPQGEKGDPGDDGYSPTVDVSDIDGGHRVTITDTDGEKVFDVMDGKDSEGGAAFVSVLDADPAEPKEGQMWILKSSVLKLTTPVIELGEVGENSIAFCLSNASFDGSGATVATYNIYVNGELNKTEDIAPGGTCTVGGLSPETEYQISVRGVSGVMLSDASNVLTATTDEQAIVIVPGYIVLTYANDLGLHITTRNDRAVAVSTSGKQVVPPIVDGVQYYMIEVPSKAVSCTVECPGMMWGYSGWNTGSDGKLTYDVDSGWHSSGATYQFEVGAAEYASFGFKKNSGGAFVAEDVAGISITFA